MSKSTGLILTVFILFSFAGCSQRYSPLSPPAIATASPTPVPAALYVLAEYRVYTFHTPCGLGGYYTEAFSRSNTAYYSRAYCYGGTYDNNRISTQQVFQSFVYADDYMALKTDGGVYSEAAIPAAAPAGTVKFYVSANGEHRVAKNAAGIITYREEHPSVRGVLDADGSAELWNYNESSVPF